jgi:hypothetical protein
LDLRDGSHYGLADFRVSSLHGQLDQDSQSVSPLGFGGPHLGFQWH